MNRDDQLIENLRQIVIDNLSNEHFSVSDLAGISGISRSHLHRRLKDIKGLSISQFIREIRLKKAVELLKQDQFTVSEIAYQVGFGSPSYFIKCFRNYYGFSPKELLMKLDEHPEGQAPVDQLLKSKKPSYSLKRSVVVIAILSVCVLAYWLTGVSGNYDNQSTEKSIAVLPFKNIGTNMENQYFADGLVEDLLNRLATNEDFKVISRTSSETYRNKPDKTVPVIAEELGVAYIVEGSVQKNDDRIKVTVQLIDARNDNHLWTRTYDQEWQDVFTMQSKIALDVGSGVSSVLTEEQSIEIQKSSTNNIDAYELYQLGRLHWNKRTVEGLEKSIAYFENAIEEDPDYALAYANMADSYFLLYVTDKMDSIRLAKSKENALKALEIDIKLPEAYNVLGGIASFIELDWPKAENYFLTGLKHNPNHSNLHHRYSEQLTYTGRHDMARQHIDKALELNPLSFIIRCVSAHQYNSTGLFNNAMDELAICYEIVPDKFHHRVRALYFELYFRSGDESGALANSINWSRNVKTNLSFEIDWDSILNDQGLKGMLNHRAELMEISIMKANFHVMAKDYDKGIECLEILLKRNPVELRRILSFHSFNDLIGNPRYLEILDALNLPWKS